MRSYLALAWRDADRSAIGARTELYSQLRHRAEWARVISEPQFELYVRGPRPPAVRRIAGGYIVGDLFGHGVGAAESSANLTVPTGTGLRAGDVIPAALGLIEHHHGRYVAIWPNGEQTAVLRDPTGALEAVSWICDGVRVVAGELSEPLPTGLTPAIRINWETVAAQLARPALIGERLALDGVIALPPGGLLDGSGQVLRLWRPQTLARKPWVGDRSQAAALAQTIERVVAAYDGASGLLCELSGGFDSSVVAAHLGSLEHAEAHLLHFAGRAAEADELNYAQCVADYCSRSLRTLALSDHAYSRDDLEALPSGWRPSMAGIDRHLDLAVADVTERLGAGMIMTGQGGDGVFFQALTPWASADLHGRNLTTAQRRAWRIAIAIATGVSYWRLLGLEWAARMGLGPRLSAPPAPWLTRRTRRAAHAAGPHGWLADLRGIAPAKREQIQALVYAQRYSGPCARSQVADVIHPLLAQPIVELCLRIPILDLTQGAEGRALARRALRGRLPPQVAQRRSKGDLTAYYGRKLARSLGAIRPFLLEGQLAAQGLVDSSVLGRWLDEGQLRELGGYGDLLQLLSFEAWARRWG